MRKRKNTQVASPEPPPLQGGRYGVPTRYKYRKDEAGSKKKVSTRYPLSLVSCEVGWHHEITLVPYGM